MSDRSLAFYAIESDFLSIACKLIEKLYTLKENVLVLCDNDEEVSFYSSKLWTFSKLAFIPNGNKDTISNEEAIFCHTWFSTDVVFYNNPVCLLHNGLDISGVSDLDKFEKVIDVFPKDLLGLAKTRYDLYKKPGFGNYKLWMQSANSWKPGEL